VAAVRRNLARNVRVRLTGLDDFRTYNALFIQEQIFGGILVKNATHLNRAVFNKNTTIPTCFKTMVVTVPEISHLPLNNAVEICLCFLRQGLTIYFPVSNIFF
jgi:hypothetical protein